MINFFKTFGNNIAYSFKTQWHIQLLFCFAWTALVTIMSGYFSVFTPFFWLFGAFILSPMIDAFASISSKKYE